MCIHCEALSNAHFHHRRQVLRGAAAAALLSGGALPAALSHAASADKPKPLQVGGLPVT